MSDQTMVDLASTQLHRIALPELQRPGVGEKEAPTLELVAWASQLYCFSLIAHFREMLRSFPVLVQAGLVPASFLAARSLFEMAAHAYYTDKHVTQYLDASDLKTGWEFLKGINMGSRYMREEYGEKREDGPLFPDSRQIAKVIRIFDEWVVKKNAAAKATTAYSFLSEFAHPYMAAFQHYYTMQGKEGDFAIVKFIQPPRSSAEAPWPCVSLSVLACLDSALRLLQRVGEEKIAPQLKEILLKLNCGTEDMH